MSRQSPEEVAAAHLAAGRPGEALLAIESVATSPAAYHTALARYASALKALERIDECLAVRRLAIERFPQSGAAWHNLAAILGDLGASAEQAAAVFPDHPAFTLSVAEVYRDAGDTRRALDLVTLAGCWSNRLGSQGHHVDHMHPRGWLSSAFYVEVPPEVGAGVGHAGWLQFGRPGLRTASPLPAAHFGRPAPGRLVLFPSYMWHGTVPFASAQTRTTVAFDVVLR